LFLEEISPYFVNLDAPRSHLPNPLVQERSAPLPDAQQRAQDGFVLHPSHSSGRANGAALNQSSCDCGLNFGSQDIHLGLPFPQSKPIMRLTVGITAYPAIADSSPASVAAEAGLLFSASLYFSRSSIVK
jgi:hypothetical protein